MTKLMKPLTLNMVVRFHAAFDCRYCSYTDPSDFSCQHPSYLKIKNKYYFYKLSGCKAATGESSDCLKCKFKTLCLELGSSKVCTVYFSKRKVTLKELFSFF